MHDLPKVPGITDVTLTLHMSFDADTGDVLTWWQNFDSDGQSRYTDPACRSWRNGRALKDALARELRRAVDDELHLMYGR